MRIVIDWWYSARIAHQLAARGVVPGSILYGSDREHVVADPDGLPNVDRCLARIEELAEGGVREIHLDFEDFAGQTGALLRGLFGRGGDPRNTNAARGYVHRVNELRERVPDDVRLSVYTGGEGVELWRKAPEPMDYDTFTKRLHVRHVPDPAAPIRDLHRRVARSPRLYCWARSVSVPRWREALIDEAMSDALWSSEQKWMLLPMLCHRFVGDPSRPEHDDVLSAEQFRSDQIEPVMQANVDGVTVWLWTNQDRIHKTPEGWRERPPAEQEKRGEVALRFVDQLLGRGGKAVEG